MLRDNSYLEDRHLATPCLQKIIAELGPLRFDHFMALALYHPQHGYYATTPNQIGRHGDFFTSVSCGPLFGSLLARHITHWHQRENITGPWRIIEPGPNNGQLARDIITALRHHAPTITQHLEYITLDPLPIPLAWQQQHLADLSPTLRSLADASTLQPLPSFLIANEILDALPCRIVEKCHTHWQELHITSDGHTLQETFHPIPVEQLPPILTSSPYPAGYRSEFRDNWHTLLDPILPALSDHSRLLWIDYGFATPEYYHPTRTRGTLRVYQRHQASENTLTNIGHSDITAHVDFTAFARYAQEKNCRIHSFQPQEFFLTRLAAEHFAHQPPTPQETRNLQTLIHPAQMGSRFHLLELAYPATTPHDTTALHRLALLDG